MHSVATGGKLEGTDKGEIQMSKQTIATAEVTIAASAKRVWDALTDPAIIKKYMFGSEVSSEWAVVESTP